MYQDRESMSFPYSTFRRYATAEISDMIGHGGEKMNQYVTGAVIKELRERNKMTQSQLADRLGVSDKTVSKWETGIMYILNMI